MWHLVFDDKKSSEGAGFVASSDRTVHLYSSLLAWWAWPTDESLPVVILCMSIVVTVKVSWKCIPVLQGYQALALSAAGCYAGDARRMFRSLMIDLELPLPIPTQYCLQCTHPVIHSVSIVRLFDSRCGTWHIGQVRQLPARRQSAATY